MEEKQTDFGVARVKVWAEENQGLSADDLFISTNVDEVLAMTGRWSGGGRVMVR